MADRIQIRRDSASNWVAENPVLAQGEFGYELVTKKLKIGDGLSAWNDLDYFISTGGVPGPPGRDGQIRFTGEGPPGVIPTALVDDTYLDILTGDIYKFS